MSAIHSISVYQLQKITLSVWKGKKDVSKISVCDTINNTIFKCLLRNINIDEVCDNISSKDEYRL